MNDPDKKKLAFTLVEIMVALSILGMVLSAAFSIYIMHKKIWRVTSLIINTSESSSNYLEKLVYGSDTIYGLREFPTDSIIATSSGGSWGWYIRNQATTWGEYSFYIYYNSLDRLYYYSAATGYYTVADDLLESTVTRVDKNGAQDGVILNISILDSIGGKSYTNSMETYVKFRN